VTTGGEIVDQKRAVSGGIVTFVMSSLVGVFGNFLTGGALPRWALFFLFLIAGAAITMKLSFASVGPGEPGASQNSAPEARAAADSTQQVIFANTRSRDVNIAGGALHLNKSVSVRVGGTLAALLICIAAWGRVGSDELPAERSDLRGAAQDASIEPSAVGIDHTASGVKEVLRYLLRAIVAGDDRHACAVVKYEDSGSSGGECTSPVQFEARENRTISLLLTQMGNPTFSEISMTENGAKACFSFPRQILEGYAMGVRRWAANARREPANYIGLELPAEKLPVSTGCSDQYPVRADLIWDGDRWLVQEQPLEREFSDILRVLFITSNE
jgi:hypothetical protein